MTLLLRSATDNANKPFPLDKIPTVEAVHYDADYSCFPLQLSGWALELGLPLLDHEEPSYLNEGWGFVARPDPRVMGVSGEGT
jgi:hypothetical protein